MFNLNNIIVVKEMFVLEVQNMYYFLIVTASYWILWSVFSKNLNNILRETSTSTHDDQIRKMLPRPTDSTISDG